MFFYKLRLLIMKLIFVLLLIALAIVAVFKYYEIIYFKPHLPYLKETYNKAKKEETVTKMVKNTILCLETYFYSKKNPYAYVVARHFVYELIESKNMSEWHIHNLLWTQLLTHYFDGEQLFILHLHLMYFQRVHGLANSAQYFFQKKISQLTVKEVVTLLGVAKSPIYSPISNPENAERIQGILMQKLKKSNCL